MFIYALKPSDLYLNIEIIKYHIILESSDSESTSFTKELDLGESFSYTPIFTKIGTDEVVVSLYFNVPTKVLGKILDIST
jgi:hypothetical protein